MSDATTVEMDQPAIIVSCDSHAGPKLMEQLRAYCPQKYLEQFDEDAAAQAKQAAGMLGAMSAQHDAPEPRPRRALGPAGATRATWTATASPPS